MAALLKQPRNSYSRSEMTSDGSTTRRRVARVVLSIGALFQLLLISALPVMQMNSYEMQKFISLSMLFVVSVGSAVGLRRWGRESIATLACGSVYAMYLMLQSAMAIQRQLSSNPPSFGPAGKLGVGLALGTLATLPIALLVAWPLGRVAPASESQSALSPGS